MITNKKSHIRLQVTILIGLFFLVPGCLSVDDLIPSFSCNDMADNSRFSSAEPFSFELDIIEQHILKLEAINGIINIVGISNSNSIKITGEKRVESSSTEDAESHIKELSVNIRDLTEEILIKTEQPEYSGGRSYIVNYNITIPKDLNISVSNANGCVTLNEMLSNVNVNLINGEIDIKVTLPVDGRIELSVINGNIDLDLPVNTSAIFTSKVTSGNISISNLELHDRKETKNSLLGILGDGQGNISLKTVNGRIWATGF
jgi:hypothetical protein